MEDVLKRRVIQFMTDGITMISTYDALCLEFDLYDSQDVITAIDEAIDEGHIEKRETPSGSMLFGICNRSK